MSCQHRILAEEIGEVEQTFAITIAILEGRHYVWPNMDSVVIVHALGKKEKSKVVRGSDSPYYDEYFTFEKKTTLDTILNSEVSITVIRPKSCCRRRKTLGYFRLDVATIWSEPGHQFFRKWAILSAPLESSTTGTRGFLKVNISLVTRNISPSVVQPVNDDEIEGNLLLPRSKLSGRSLAKYEFHIYRGEYFYNKTKAPSSVYITVSFFGNHGRTSSKNNTSAPVFNEKITLKDLFPPLCQRFHIAVYFGKTLHTTGFLYLRNLITEQEDCQLPMFGPSFLHFYDNIGMEAYRGLVLLSLRTKLDIPPMEAKEKTPNVAISPPAENLLSSLTLRLFVVILECSALDKRFDGNVFFRIAIGNELIDAESQMNNFEKSDKMKVVKINRNSRYLQIKEQKPLLTMLRNAVDFRKRMQNLNMLEKIADELSRKLEDISKLYAEDDAIIQNDIKEQVMDSYDYLKTATKKYLDIASNYNLDDLNDHHKATLKNQIRIMEQISQKAETAFDPNFPRKSFMKIQKLYDRLFCLLDYINDMWPDIFISIWKGNKKLAYVRLPCKNLLFSPIEEEKGPLCGTKVTLFLQSERKKRPKSKDITNMVGKMEVLLWLGNEKYSSEFTKKLPRGFEEISSRGLRFIEIEQKLTFQCRCHLFQGRIDPGFDKTALCDAMARVHLEKDCQETTIQHKTLNPVWNQTLIFRNITLYGDAMFIKNSPPSIIVELLDRDSFYVWEHIGRTEIKPIVKTAEEAYGPPNFPPKLSWYKVVNHEGTMAEILGAFEMLEVTGDDAEDAGLAEKDIIRIPDDIKPEEVGFRCEVYFWGLRNVKRTHLDSVRSLQMSLKCSGWVIESEILKNSKSNPNFDNPLKMVEVMLPKNVEYASPLIIKMKNKKNCSTVLGGTNVTHLKSFIIDPMTEEQRYDILNGKLNYENEEHFQGDASSIDSIEKKLEVSPPINFIPQHCFCKTTQAKKLVKKISKIRCICQKTRWQKFRQAFNKKKIFCPCSEQYEKEIEKVSKEHKKFCGCCRKLLRKLHLAADAENNQPSCWALIWDSLKSSCLKGKCACCRKIAEKIKVLCMSSSDKCSTCKKNLAKIFKRKDKKTEEDGEQYDETYESEEFDWWTKFYVSLEPPPATTERTSIKMKYRLKIYLRELETLPEFHYFQDQFISFPMYKGKRTGDDILDKDMVMAVFKGAIKIYRWPPPSKSTFVTKFGTPLADGYFINYPTNAPVNYLVRVYCIRAIHLPPKDMNGKCDPYLVLRLNNKEINDKKNYVMEDLNPVFGKMYEFSGIFPYDTNLLVQVWDMDKTTGDDLIGQTSIDLEERFYTEHRASCGIPEFYEEKGYCAWRDNVKPSIILEDLCKKMKMPNPTYGATSVVVGSKVFEAPHYEPSGDDHKDKEVKALHALRSWHEVPYVGCRLVPEHVETRSLFNRKKALVEQGKLQLWVDLFFSLDQPPPNPIDISVKPPKLYELRVIIWNTADVLLQEDDFFTNQKKSDIFVKGSLLGCEDVQSTDVHYRSLSGEGNFNWRFIFPLSYLPNEDKTITYKERAFGSKKKEIKFPCRLMLQVWENDSFSVDDFLGSLSFDLSHIPRGSKSSEKCSFDILEPKVPHINLFKKKRIKGWWPFRGNDLEGNMTLVGKVEAELEILTAEEAAKNPAGLGRNDPQALPAPKRPDTSFSWFKNPLKSMKYVVCKLHRWKMICCCFCLLLIIFIIISVYAFPGYVVKKILHA